MGCYDHTILPHCLSFNRIVSSFFCWCYFFSVSSPIGHGVSIPVFIPFTSSPSQSSANPPHSVSSIKHPPFQYFAKLPPYLLSSVEPIPSKLSMIVISTSIGYLIFVCLKDKATLLRYDWLNDSIIHACDSYC